MEFDRSGEPVSRIAQASVETLLLYNGLENFEPFWNLVIQLKKLNLMTPLFEGVLSKATKQNSNKTKEAMTASHTSL